MALLSETKAAVRRVSPPPPPPPFPAAFYFSQAQRDCVQTPAAVLSGLSRNTKLLKRRRSCGLCPCATPQWAQIVVKKKNVFKNQRSLSNKHAFKVAKSISVAHGRKQPRPRVRRNARGNMDRNAAGETENHKFSKQSGNHLLKPPSTIRIICRQTLSLGPKEGQMRRRKK